MGQPEAYIDMLLDWQHNPQPDAPNVFITGSAIASMDRRGDIPHHAEIENPEEGRKIIHEYVQKGLKHVKLYWRLRLSDFKAVAQEAQKHNLVINAHVDQNIVNIQDAMNLDVHNFEHFFTIARSSLQNPREDTQWHGRKI